MLHTDIPHEFPGPYAHLGCKEFSRGCIFDNTALGAATVDALTVKSHLLDGQRVIT